MSDKTDLSWRVLARDMDNLPFSHGLFIPEVPEPVVRINRLADGRYFWHGLGVSTAPAGTAYLAESKAQAEDYVRRNL